MTIIRRNPILRRLAHLLAPAIMLFALYVQFHGEYSAGGGFQAGVIFAIALILYVLVHGVDDMLKLVSLRLAELIAAIGLLIYIGTGIAAMFSGGNFLSYSALAEVSQRGQQVGIFLIELGVGITIVGIVMLVFCLIMKKVNVD